MRCMLWSVVGGAFLLAACGVGGCGQVKPETAGVFNVPFVGPPHMAPPLHEPPAFRVERLAATGDAPAGDAAATTEPPAFRLTWDQDNLKVVVVVNDTTPEEEANDAALYAKDSVELFVGRADDLKQYYQLVVAPGMDAAHAEARKLFFDHRAPKAGTLEGRVLRTKSAGGYTLTVELPWKNVGLTGQLGEKFRFQIFVNDSDGTGQRRQHVWFPSTQSYQDPTALYTMCMSERPSPAITVLAKGDYQEFRRARVVVQDSADQAGNLARVYEGGSHLGDAIMERTGRHAEAEVLLPMPPSDKPYKDLTVEVAGGVAVPVKMPELTDDARLAALRKAELRFSAYAFTGEALPTPSFASPLHVEDILGPYVIHVRYFAADYSEVTRAEKPGRYGAVVEVQARSGLTWKQYVTLYRMPAEIKDTDGLKLALTVELPKELGIEATIAREQGDTLAEAFKWLLLDGAKRDGSVAVVLAGLAETPAGSGRAVQREDAWARNQHWWFGLKQKLGEGRYEYLTYLPAELTTERGSEKKWPLILFLHGSGQRGRDVNRVADTGLPERLKSLKDFPFIVISPQCPEDEWWNIWAVNSLLDEIVAKYPVDPDRIYLTGLSMGGFGSWQLAAAFPGRFAAVAPVCGIGDKNDVAPLKDLPIWAFHGEADPVVKFERDAEVVAALKAIGGRVRFTSYPGVGHDSWTATYADPRLYDWFLAQKRGAPAEPPGGTGGAATLPAKP